MLFSQLPRFLQHAILEQGREQRGFAMNERRKRNSLPAMEASSSPALGSASAPTEMQRLAGVKPTALSLTSFEAELPWSRLNYNTLRMRIGNSITFTSQYLKSFSGRNSGPTQLSKLSAGTMGQSSTLVNTGFAQI